MLTRLHDSSGLTPLLYYGKKQVYQIDKSHQNNAQGNRQAKITSANLLHDGSCEHAGLTLNVASNHHRGADLRYYRTEASHNCRQERQAGVLDQKPQQLPARCPQGNDLKAELGVNLLDRSYRKTSNNGEGDNELSNNYGIRSIHELK